jgi:hypothetical protein
MADDAARGKGFLFRMTPDKLWRPDPETGRTPAKGADHQVWLALCFIAKYPRQDYVDATDDAIAREAGVAARSVRDSVARLKARGFLEQGRGDRGRRLFLRPEGPPQGDAAGPRFKVIG